MQGRAFEDEGYRYGFNGQEKDDDAAKGSYSAEFWQYSPSIGKRWNVDPVEDLGVSPYATFTDNPIFYNDPNGDCPKCNKESYKAGISDTWSYDENGKGTHWFLQENNEWLNITGKDVELYRGNKTIKFGKPGHYDYRIQGMKNLEGLRGMYWGMSASLTGVAGAAFIGGAGAGQVGTQAVKTFMWKYMVNVGLQAGVHTSVSLIEGRELTFDNTLGKVDHFDAALSSTPAQAWLKWVGTAAIDGTGSGGMVSVFGKKSFKDTAIDFGFNFGLGKLSNYGQTYFSRSINARSIVNSHLSVLEAFGGNRGNWFQIPIGIPKGLMGPYSRVRWPIVDYSPQINNWLSPAVERGLLRITSNPHVFSISGMAGKRATKDGTR